MKSLAELDNMIEVRATRLVRLHVAGRRPIADAAKLKENARRRDRAFDLLIAAVERRDREIERQMGLIAAAPARTPRRRP